MPVSKGRSNETPELTPFAARPLGVPLRRKERAAWRAHAYRYTAI